MARRNFIKAYSDIVGGTGTDVSVSMGPCSDVTRKTSVIKLSKNDASYGNRQAVEVRPMPTKPLQLAHPHHQKNAKTDKKCKKDDFVNIDMDVAEKRESVELNVPQTAHKMQSFMSLMELGERNKPRSSSRNNHDLRPRPEKLKTNIGKPDPPSVMPLPKGIDRTDQPYVLPKFMPSYRELMTAKPKQEPLVSIVEPTPPSMQKWAVEWNAEPKNISIAELKEDIMRETAGQDKAERRPMMPSIEESEPPEPAKSDVEDFSRWSSQIAEKHMEKPVSNAPERTNNTPWNDTLLPTNYDDITDTEGFRGSALQNKLQGHPVIDWVPSKYHEMKKLLNEPRIAEYSFKDAIKQGGLVERVPEKNNPRFPLSKPGAVVSYDHDEQKFHEWFKERMSTAVKSNIHSKHLPKNVGATTKLSASPTSIDSSIPKGTQLAETESNFSSNHRNKGEVEVSPVVLAEPKSKPPVTSSYELEKNSSFCKWLKLRGHNIRSSEPSVSVPQVEDKAALASSNGPKFPWSVSYTLRKKLATPQLVSKKRSKEANSFSRLLAQKKHSSGGKSFANLPKAVCRSNTNLKSAKSYLRKKSFDRKSIKSTNKKSMKSFDQRPVKNLNNEPIKRDERLATSVENVYPELIADAWNIDSEIDHVNNLRKMELRGNNAKSMKGSSMNYWEAKYKPAETQRQLRTNDNGTCAYKWLRPVPKTATEGFKNVFKDVLTVRQSASDENVNFSNIGEYSRFPLNLTQTSRSSGLDLPEDFDVDKFLTEEETAEKQLLEATRGEQDRFSKVGASGKQQERTEESNGNNMKGKETIKFPRDVNAQTEKNLHRRVQHQVNEDELVLALGDDPGLTDLEWTEFIGSRNNWENDSDLTRLLKAQTRQPDSFL